jgi:hypothetical protein
MRVRGRLWRCCIKAHTLKAYPLAGRLDRCGSNMCTLCYYACPGNPGFQHSTPGPLEKDQVGHIE